MPTNEGGEVGGRALSFGPAAGLYEQARPGYPAEAVAWMLGVPPQLVVDLGAGTGKFSRALVTAGHDVVAVEPDPLMAAELRAAGVPGVRVLAGRAEAIPVRNAGVDAVVAAQAYHWFEPVAAHAEIARVVRPGGVFAPLWNLRDDSVPWVAELSCIAGSEDTQRDAPERLAGFGQFEAAEFRHTTTLTADSLVALVATRSYYLTAGPGRRAEIEAGLRELAAGLPARFDLPYRTVAFRAVREGAPIPAGRWDGRRIG